MIYTYRCNLCEHTQDANRSMSDRDNAPDCAECGADMKKVITKVEVNGYFLGSANNPGYMCPVSDTWVSSKRQRRDIMDKHNLLEKG